jgi:hypothetical protein
MIVTDKNEKSLIQSKTNDARMIIAPIIFTIFILVIAIKREEQFSIYQKLLFHQKL